MDRLAPTRRPPRREQGYQRWDRLLFVHWEVPYAQLRAQVPGGLELDAFDGRYFVGVVVFMMQGVRPFRWAPAFPTARSFAELNVRTYVHLNGSEPGVYFFSLDAGSTLAVLAARTLWRLPYFRSRFLHQDDGTRIRWECRRRWPRPSAAPFSTKFEVGRPIENGGPGTLEFFLAERYQFYVQHGETLFRARVHHAPYPLHQAQVSEVGTSLLASLGLSLGPRTPDYFSPGVDVEVFTPEVVS